MSESKVVSRASKITMRETPVSAVSSAASGGLRIHAETIAVPTRERIELIDITERLMALVRQTGVREGTVSVWSMHTTCAVLINESQKALLADMKRFLEELVDADAAWLHDDPAHSDCSRANADSHLRAMLLGHSVTLQIASGEPVLGQWQRVFMVELDGPRERTLRVQVMGLA